MPVTPIRRSTSPARSTSLDEYKRAYGLLGAGDRVSLQATTAAHGYVYEMRRATYALVQPLVRDEERRRRRDVAGGGVGRDALRDADRFRDDVVRRRNGAVADAADGRGDPHRRRRSPRTTCVHAIRSVLGIEESRGEAPAGRVLATIKKPGYRAEQFEFTSDREIRTPGWLLTPDNAGPSTPTVLYVGEAAAWSSVAEDAFAERLCAKGGCRVAVIDVRGRGDCAIAYPPRGRFYFPDRIPDEAYLTWFTLMLGRPLLGGQVYDTLRALDYLRSRPDVGAPCRSWATDRTA